MKFSLFRLIVEGRLLLTCLRYIEIPIKKVFSELDRIGGIIARAYLKATLPIDNNKVFFHTQEMTYCCNPKYITEELLRQQKENPDVQNIDIVWRTATDGKGGLIKGRGDIPVSIRAVPANTLEYFKEMLTARVVITNSFLYLGQPVKLRKDQYLIQTWHGSLGIKKYGPKDIKDTWRRVSALKETGKMTSYCVSNSELENNSFRDTYWPKTPILDYGHARNDLFCEGHEKERAEVRERVFRRLGISPEKKVVMYGPTFRDEQGQKSYKIDFRKLVDALTERFGGEWCVILRYHPSLAKVLTVDSQIAKWPGVNIVDGTVLPDMQELIAATDVAVTDYSSWIYDFMLMRKPGFIYATDLKDYDQERGFYYPIETTPFDIAENSDELASFIRGFDEKAYLEKVEQFLVDKGCIEDGHAAERAVQLIRDLMDGKEPQGPVV